MSKIKIYLLFSRLIGVTGHLQIFLNISVGPLLFHCVFERRLWELRIIFFPTWLPVHGSFQSFPLLPQDRSPNTLSQFTFLFFTIFLQILWLSPGWFHLGKILGSSIPSIVKLTFKGELVMQCGFFRGYYSNSMFVNQSSVGKSDAASWILALSACLSKCAFSTGCSYSSIHLLQHSTMAELPLSFSDPMSWSN